MFVSSPRKRNAKRGDHPSPAKGEKPSPSSHQTNKKCAPTQSEVDDNNAAGIDSLHSPPRLRDRDQMPSNNKITEEMVAWDKVAGMESSDNNSDDVSFNSKDSILSDVS